MALHVTKQFTRAIQNNPSNCVLLVGAGLSAAGVRKGGKGLPDWRSLMRHIIDELKESGSCGDDDLTKLRKALKEGKYLEIAATYKQHTRPDQFAAFLRDELDPQDITDSELHAILLRTGFRGILTTNFDMVFEHQSNRLQPLVYPQCLDDVESFRKHGFFAKIHGCIRNTPNLAQNLVLAEESYISLRRNSKYQTILRSVLVLNPLLTVGFSLSDPDFLGVMDDLREVFSDTMPTVYALMRDPGRKTRDEWRAKGVEVLPYQDHGQIKDFFQDLLRLSEPSKSTGPTTVATSEPEIDYASFADQWRKEQKVEKMYEKVSAQLKSLSADNEREAFLYRLLAFVEEDDELQLAPHILALNTPQSTALVRAIFKRSEKEGTYGLPQPHNIHLNLHSWVLEHWHEFADSDYGSDKKRQTWFRWLLRGEWTKAGVNLHGAFRSILDTVVQRPKRSGLLDLYEACDEVAGAREEIERIALAEGFADASLADDIRKKKFLRETPYGDMDSIDALCRRLADAAHMDASRSDSIWGTYTAEVAERLLEPYVHVTYLTVHGSSGVYDPDKARRILDALAGIKGKRLQLSILASISRREWDSPRHSPDSEWDNEVIKDGLFVPLWWRYCSDTRLEYLQHYRHRGRMMEGGPRTTGQEMLLETLMGLTYDVDKDFRAGFDAVRERYRSKECADATERYDPRPLQEIWRGRELTYKTSDEVPPELIRRAAAKGRGNLELGAEGDRLKQARERAERAVTERALVELVSREQKNYVIDNLLGSYSPEEVEVVLYPKVIEVAASTLGLETDTLGTVVYIHETAHAFSHLGRDTDGRQWSDYAPSPGQVSDVELGRLHEAIAQYYTFKLLERLDDATLLNAFEVLEECSTEVYRAWRQVQHYSLEQMREVLVRLRRRNFDWPPVQSTAL